MQRPDKRAEERIRVFVAETLCELSGRTLCDGNKLSCAVVTINFVVVAKIHLALLLSVASYLPGPYVAGGPLIAA